MSKYTMEVVGVRGPDGTYSDMRIQVSDLCATCRRMHESRFTCEAFPELIPTEIRIGEVDHVKPYPGDHGITYAPYPDLIAKPGAAGAGA